MRVYRLEAPPAGLEGLDAVAIRPDAAESMEELRLAHHLAKRSFENKRNIAKKFKFEFLLWLSGTRDIKNAMKRTSPGEGECLLVMFSGSPPSSVKEKGLGLKEKADPLRLEDISLSRLKG
jgi:tRNA threonylcarbamoyladenosine modification (KEOPS) complex Cgi121 subunit